MRCAGAPIWLCGSSAMPCASKLRWSIRASMSSSASRSLANSAHRSRQRSTISVRFHSRTFGPKPFSSTVRMVSMTCAWGLGLPSSAMSQCTLRSAIMPRSTNSDCTKSRASSMPCACVISRGRENSTSRASCASFLISKASTSFQSRSRSRHASGAFSGSMTSEWTTPRLPEKSWLRSSRSSRSREAER